MRALLLNGGEGLRPVHVDSYVAVAQKKKNKLEENPLGNKTKKKQKEGGGSTEGRVKKFEFVIASPTTQSKF